MIKVKTAKQKKINLLLPPINYEISLSGGEKHYVVSCPREPQRESLCQAVIWSHCHVISIFALFFLFLRTFRLKLLFLNYSCDFLWSQSTTFYHVFHFTENGHRILAQFDLYAAHAALCDAVFKSKNKNVSQPNNPETENTGQHKYDFLHHWILSVSLTSAMVSLIIWTHSVSKKSRLYTSRVFSQSHFVLVRYLCPDYSASLYLSVTDVLRFVYVRDSDHFWSKIVCGPPSQRNDFTAEGT